MSTNQLVTTEPQIAPLAPLAPLDIEATKHAMDMYQRGLHALLDETDSQTIRSGSEERSFVKRSGYRKIALWFSLSLEVRTIEVDRDDEDRPVRARVIARATAPNGRFAEGDGAASTTERRFSKPEHDLAAVASTRATNRAISNLVGLGAVSAEEVDAAPDPDAPPALPYGPLADQANEAEAAQLIQAWHPSIDGFALLDIYKRTLGTERLPEAAFRMVKAIEWGIDSATGNERDAPAADPSYQNHPEE